MFFTPELSRLALKIVVMTREQGTGNREQEESFGRFYFSSHTFKFLCSPTYILIIITMNNILLMNNC
jgi:hypothetical protein